MSTLTRPGLPAVIGHRGAPGYRPEHTLASYRLAIEQGADAVEPDLVATRDGVLVIRHENEISGTTDVASRPELAGRRTTKVVDGRELTGWFTEDLTLAELKSLRAVERLPRLRPHNTAYDGRHDVATFDELVLLVGEESRRRGRRIGLNVELKSSTYFAARGLPLDELVLASLRDHGLDRRGARVWLQSFETAPLRRLSTMTDLPLVQLVESGGAPVDRVAVGDPTTYADLVTPAGLRAVSGYADAVGVRKDLVLTTDPASGELRTSTLVEDAHLAGLTALVWTLRSENSFLTPGLRRGTDPAAHGDAAGEARALFDAGVDAVFSDQPDVTLRARAAWARSRVVAPRGA